MTCREKLRLEHPTRVVEAYGGGCYGCPYDYKYLTPNFDYRKCMPDGKKCTDCWNQEIPDAPLITPGIIPTSISIDTDTDTLRKLVNSANEMTLAMKKMTEAMEYLTITAKELYMKLEIEKGKLEHGRAADTQDA